MSGYRHTVGVIAVCCLLATTGCLGFITGSDSLAFDAADVEVQESALDSTGYQLAQDQKQNVSREFSVAGQSRNVSLTNYITGYNRSVPMGPLGEFDIAQFVVFSTPAVKIAGQTLNPVSSWSKRKILNRLSTSNRDTGQITHESNRTVKSLGSQRQVAKFSSTTTVQGQDVPVFIHVAKFKHDDDFLVVLAVHPERTEGEQQRVNTMLGNLTHPAS